MSSLPRAPLSLNKRNVCIFRLHGKKKRNTRTPPSLESHLSSLTYICNIYTNIFTHQVYIRSERGVQSQCVQQQGNKCNACLLFTFYHYYCTLPIRNFQRGRLNWMFYVFLCFSICIEFHFHLCLFFVGVSNENFWKCHFLLFALNAFFLRFESTLSVYKIYQISVFCCAFLVPCRDTEDCVEHEDINFHMYEISCLSTFFVLSKFTRKI